RVVFINGRLNRELSQLDELPAEVSLRPLAEALEDSGLSTWIELQSAQPGGTARNAFLPLNRAFAEDGLVLTVGRNYRLERPIHLIYLSAPGEAAHIANPQLFVWAKTGSEVTFIESYHALQAGTYFNNTASWIDLEANARVSHYKLQREGQDAFQVNNTLVRQDRDSCYNSYAVDLGGRLVRNNVSVELRDSNTETHLYGTYLGAGSQHIDNQTFIDHAVPHCESNELYKGILKDKARGVFNGKVLVRQDAQKTNAFQQNSSLVLSPWAVMDAKPQLEIFADDVRCSHGATIGHLDETSVFYLRSRGIPEDQARNLLQQAFLGEVIENMGLDEVREHVSQLIAAKLSDEA
ncbi:MAG: Fe-S cluster assembly protein SufD, partial [Lewinella sp.]|nr:Fe-S cluster assembly protein SufD [Lewinella sp.]